MSKKSRKLIRTGQDAAASDPVVADAAPTVPADGPYAAFADRDWQFHFLPDVEPHVVDEKALHGLMKDWRHGRATRSIWQAFGDAYIALFSLVVIGGMAGNALFQAQARAANCTTAACGTSRGLVPWALVCAAAALTLAAARIFGPVLASAAEGFWLMDSPIARSRLLRPRLWGVVLGALGVGTVLGALVAALSGVSLVGVAAFALATGAVASALMAWSAVAQEAEVGLPGRLVQGLFSLVGVGIVAVMVLVASGLLDAAALPPLGGLAWVVAAVGGVALVVGLVVGLGRLERLRRARLQSGGALVSGMQGAMFALDLGLARDILVERDSMARGFVRPTAGRGTGVMALVWRDVQRLVRFPKPLVGLVAAMLVPYAADAIGLGAANPLVSALALVIAIVPLLGALRVLSRTRGLARTFPFSTPQLRTATMAVPAVLGLVWAGVTVPAFVGIAGGQERALDIAVLTALATAAAGVLGAVRWQTGGQVDYSAPLVSTGTGAMPMSLMTNLVRGLDVVAVVTLPLIFGLSPLWSLGIAAVVFLMLRAGMNLEEMQAQAADEKEKLEAERAASGAAKKRIAPPSR